MIYKSWNGICLCAEADCFPADAKCVSAPFSPLVLLVNRDPMVSRGIYAISEPEEYSEPENLSCLLPCTGKSAALPAQLCSLIKTHGAAVLNTAFSNAFPVLDAFLHRKKEGLKITLVGLGDVGGTVLTGLKLLGTEISEISVFDPYVPMCARYEMELNQVLPDIDGRIMPKITVCSEDRLFDCDVFIFTASRGVPALNSSVKDVRMAQYEANREMLRSYAKAAREANFRGIFCQVSDPVDHLARSVFLSSNQAQDGSYDFSGLLPEQVQGFGLGVMAARAAYWAEKDGIDFSSGRVYGPHGEGLIVANRCDEGYESAISEQLTAQTREANLRVRELGFKPYIAPGLSSAAISILRMLRGQVHYGAVPIGGTYFGCRNYFSENGLSILREPISPALFSRISETYTKLKEFRYE